MTEQSRDRPARVQSRTGPAAREAPVRGSRHQLTDLGGAPFGGRYTLLRRLAVGGMAEIYLARQAAMAGFEKEVVIKRLRDELAGDPRIVEMFLDEARIGALLNHPNIVHVYDVDEHDDVPYIAMEYIVGEELNELCRRGLALDRFLPLEHAVELMRQAAAGLGYFHSKRGGEGTPLADQPLAIVHLDISPSNLLVTQDGFLKVIDFGIANARGQRSRGDVLPGKLGYMAPEQAARKAVDHRSDIFSLGIVLYEITVGKRLFRGPAQEVIERLVAAQIEPPTFARRNFPSALEAIVMKALEKHPEDRYQSAYDLADDLESFLRDERMHSGPVRIARYLDNLAAIAGQPRRPELVSEPEGTKPGAELDFDREVFETFAPAPGAPGPAQAREWEDPEQPDVEVAAALGVGLAELHALRTPVPPSSPVEPPEPEPAPEPAPVPGLDPDATATPDPTPPGAPAPAAAPAPAPVATRARGSSSIIAEPIVARAEPDAAPRVATGVEEPAGGDPAGGPDTRALVVPPISALPARPSRMPWVLVAMLGVALASAVAYIVGT